MLGCAGNLQVVQQVKRYWHHRAVGGTAQKRSRSSLLLGVFAWLCSTPIDIFIQWLAAP
jgi:hypothetical protein